MKYVILHRSSHRIRIKIPLVHMSYEQADLIEYYLKSIPQIKKVSVDERTSNATITFDKGAFDIEPILDEALINYDENSESVKSLLPEETGRALNRKYQEKLLIKVLVHNVVKIFLPLPIRNVRTLLKSAPYIINAVKSIQSGRLKVEMLDGIAIMTSLLRNDYDTASSIIFLLNTGEIIEDWTRKKSIGDLARAMSLNVDKVWLKRDDTEINLSIKDVEVGDQIVVRSSDIIPLDGKVISGEMTVNQSTMTGESEPVMKKEGGYVYAGTVVDEGECIIEVVKKFGNGKYDQIVRIIEESEKLKSETEAKAYRLADSLVPYSFAGTILTYLFTRNVNKAMAFLMVDYSCAMKLSMPLSVLSAIKEARNYGISVKGGKFMEAISEADTILFDKTGTLTYATPKLVDVVTFGDNDPDEMLRIAACLEEHYPHSVANAIVQGALDKGLHHEELHSKVEYIVAHGVASFVSGKKAVIGSYHFVVEDEGNVIPEEEMHKLDQLNEEYSKIYLAIDGVLTAVLNIFDPVREEAVEVIEKLHNMGFKNICMLTGDNEKTASYVAKQLGLDNYLAGVLPTDKSSYVKKMREEGHTVLMVGDGVNDSPALSEANVGIAMDSGAAIAREISDITISSDDLMTLVHMRKLSCELMKRIRNNYHFIIGFNSLLIGLGLFELITPSSSALLHNSSTIITGLKSTTNLLT